MALSKVGHLKKKLEEPSTSLLPSKKRLKYESQKKINYFDRLPDEVKMSIKGCLIKILFEFSFN